MTKPGLFLMMLLMMIGVGRIRAQVTDTNAAAATIATAYMLQTDYNDMPDCCGQVARLMAASDYAIVDDADTADYIVELYSDISLGSTVSGGIVDLNECFCTLRVVIYPNHTDLRVLDYATPQIQVYTPINKTLKQITSMCTREVMKRVNRELPVALRQMTEPPVIQ